MSRLLLTGATGFLGMELLVRLLERTDREVTCLVRAPDDEVAAARLEGVLDALFPPEDRPAPGRVRAIAADLERPGLGLDPGAARRLMRDVSTVVHCAASVSFTLPLEDARRINVEGTRGVLELAALAPGLTQLVHVSTAYVAGDRAGRAYEHEHALGQAHRNTYEQTKLEAEALVRASGLPAAILRPSIVVGDSRTGWTPAFNVIYWPLQGFARGLLPSIAAEPDGLVDVVPIDAVADALLALTARTGERGCFHVVAGDGALTCAAISEMAAAAFGRSSPPFVPLGHDLVAEEVAAAFLPYFRVRASFDPGAGAGLAGVPSLADYFPTLMDYAREARWGKRPLTRWERARALATV